MRYATDGATPSSGAATDAAAIPAEQRYAAALAEAKAHVQVATMEMKRNSTSAMAGQGSELLSPDGAPYRWFLLPAEAAAMLRGTAPAARSPFHPHNHHAPAPPATAAGAATGGAGAAD